MKRKFLYSERLIVPLASPQAMNPPDEEAWLVFSLDMDTRVIQAQGEWETCL